jgi:Na+/melibiose symporter-like transporter
MLAGMSAAPESPEESPCGPSGLLDRLAQPHDGSPLPGWKLGVFASPSVAMRAMYYPLMIYVPAMYTEEFGLGLATLGLVFTAIRIVDMAWDPVVALFLDRTETRFGRRRPWVIAATPILLFAVVLLYMPAAIVGDRVTPLYLFLSLAVLYVGQTLYGLSHGAWGAELSTDYNERSRIQAYIEWVGTAGGLAILGIPIFVEVFIDAERMSPRVEAMAWFTLIVVPITVVCNVLWVPERRVAPQPRTRLGEALKLLVTNPHLVRLAVIDAMFGIQMGVSAALMVFWVKYWIEVPQATTTVILLSQVGALVAIPLWTKLSGRVGKHKAVGIAYTVYLGVHLFYPLIGKGDIVFFWVLVALTGSSAYSARFLVKSITIDVVDYDNWKSGQERTALFLAVLSTTERIGPAIAIGITLPLLAFLGFDPANAEPDASARQALRWVFILMPMLVFRIAAYLLYSFRLDENLQRDLRRMIEERDAPSQ